MLEVIDNFLPQDYFDNLLLLIEDLPWFFRDWSVYEGDHQPQFYHLLYFNSEVRSHQFYKYVEEVYSRYVPNAKEHDLYRMKFNATPRGNTIEEKEFHVDSEDDHLVCILYMNTNDGYTLFEHNQEKVMSVANRACLFPGHLKHTGTNCTDAPIRIVLNIDYVMKKA